jgi:hypothetical protein
LLLPRYVDARLSAVDFCRAFTRTGGFVSTPDALFGILTIFM